MCYFRIYPIAKYTQIIVPSPQKHLHLPTEVSQIVACGTPMPATVPILIDSMIQASVKQRFGLSDTLGFLSAPTKQEKDLDNKLPHTILI